MNLEKVIKLSSFLPGMLFVNTKKHTENTFKKFKMEVPSKGMNLLGSFYEGMRLIATGIAAVHGVEPALITYGVSTYILDRAAYLGFVPMN